MEKFVSRIMKNRRGVYYFTIPDKIMGKMKLKPFMAGEMKAAKGKITLSGFEKTVKIKIDLEEKTLSLLKKLMREEGYASLDETISNVVRRFFTKKETHIVYIYPGEYLKGNYTLIDDYEKRKIRKNALKKHSKNS